ncbi:hypothetical protein Ct61P_15090 [Colletotrichum tofieldiae]|nr:hypothetical protein Ct61P_15090 [Colletotrichum tofieldiae]
MRLAELIRDGDGVHERHLVEARKAAKKAQEAIVGRKRGQELRTLRCAAKRFRSVANPRICFMIYAKRSGVWAHTLLLASVDGWLAAKGHGHGTE